MALVQHVALPNAKCKAKTRSYLCVGESQRKFLGWAFKKLFLSMVLILLEIPQQKKILKKRYIHAMEKIFQPSCRP